MIPDSLLWEFILFTPQFSIGHWRFTIREGLHFL